MNVAGIHPNMAPCRKTKKIECLLITSHKRWGNWAEAYQKHWSRWTWWPDCYQG